MEELPKHPATMVTITRPLLETVADVAKRKGCTSVTSVGCGEGCFEFHLAGVMDTRVRGIDVGAFDVAPLARPTSADPRTT